MTIAVYIRVSTAGQNESGQRREIAKWLSGNGIQSSSVQWYVDKESGDTLNRPEFEQMQKDVFAGTIKTIVVYKLDRISRSLRDGINALCDWCERSVRVVAVSQQIDFSGTLGRMIASVLFAVAELEQTARRERQASGIAVAKELGIYKGRKKGAIKPGVDLERALELRNMGLRNKEIAASMGVSTSSVTRYLKMVAS